MSDGARIHWLASAPLSEPNKIQYAVRSPLYSAIFSFEHEPLIATGHASVLMKKWLYKISATRGDKISAERGDKFRAQREQAPKFLSSGEWGVQAGGVEHASAGEAKTVISADEFARMPSFLNLPELPFALNQAIASDEAAELFGTYFPVSDKIFAMRVARVSGGTYRGQIAKVTSGFDETAFANIEWQKRSSFTFDWDVDRKLISAVVLQIPTLGQIRLQATPLEKLRL